MEVAKQYLVTGAAGFLARRVVVRLLQLGASVRGLIRSTSSAADLLAYVPASLHGRLELVLGDFVRDADCRRVVTGCDVVLHIGAQLTGSTAPLVLTNVVGTKRLIRAAAEAGVERFVLISSIAVYDTQKLRRQSTVDEALTLDPKPELRDPYTFSKVEQERIAETECRQYRLPLVIVRPGVIYGPGRDTLSARVGLHLGNLVMVMNGRHRLPYTHVENCADAVILAGSTPHLDGQAFNIVDDDSPTGDDVLRARRKAGKKSIAVRLPLFLTRKIGVVNEWYHRWSQGQFPAVLTPYKVEAMWKPLRFSNARAKETLGWRPKNLWTSQVNTSGSY